MSRPWLSVVMPTYNGAPYLAAALGSVAAEGADEVEVLAIDDGSTDGTVSVLKSFDGRLRIRLFQCEHVGNWVAHTNEGLAQATADYVCLLHQDDCWLPGRLAALKRLMAAAPGAALYLHASSFLGPDGRWAGRWRCPLPADRPLPPSLVLERLLVQNFIAAPAPLFRRGAALAVGGLDPALWYAADWDFWLKLAATGPTVYHARPLTAFRVHPLSQLMVRGSRIDEVRRQLHAVLDRHLALCPAGASEQGAVRRAARFSLEVNVRLLGWYHGHRAGWLDLLGRFVALGPSAWHRLFRDSRIVERTLARLRGGVLPHRRGRPFETPPAPGERDPGPAVASPDLTPKGGG